MVVGIVMCGIGPIGALIGFGVYLNPSGEETVGGALVAAGGATADLGMLLAITGGSKVRVSERGAVLQWAVAPGGGTLRWEF